MQYLNAWGSCGPNQVSYVMFPLAAYQLNTMRAICVERFVLHVLTYLSQYTMGFIFYIKFVFRLKENVAAPVTSEIHILPLVSSIYFLVFTMLYTNLFNLHPYVHSPVLLPVQKS